MMMRIRWMVVFAVVIAAICPCGASAAEIAGNWVAEGPDTERSLSTASSLAG